MLVVTNIPISKLALRHRTNFEAIGAGTLLARQYWWQLVAGWLIFALPIFVAVWFVPNVFLSVFLLWLFKPLYERIPLRFIASTMFNQQTTAKQTLSTVFSVDTLIWLSVFRLCPGRSTLTPIAALERSSDNLVDIPSRRKLIRQRILGNYLILHLLMFGLEISLVVFLLVVVYWAVFVLTSVAPDLPSFNPFVLFNFLASINKHIFTTLIFLSFAVIAPFYVCCGFSTYLNKRIELEGWDIDLGFRRLIARVSMLLITVFLVANGDLSYAQMRPGIAVDKATIHETVKSEIDAIYVESIITEETIRARESVERATLETEARVLQIIAIVALISFIVFLLWQLRRVDFSRFKPRKVALESKQSTIVAAFHERLELPDDVLASSREAWESGNSREAISLLYRGALYYLVSYYECPVHLSHTESACLQLVAENVPQSHSSFATITGSWQKIAYANKPIETPAFQALVHVYETDFT